MGRGLGVSDLLRNPAYLVGRAYQGIDEMMTKKNEVDWTSTAEAAGPV